MSIPDLIEHWILFWALYDQPRNNLLETINKSCFFSQTPKFESKDAFEDDDDFNLLPLDEEPPDVDQVFSHKEVLEDNQYPSASSTPVKVTV